MYTAIKAIQQDGDQLLIKRVDGAVFGLPLVEWQKFGKVLAGIPKPAKAFKPDVGEIQLVGVKQRKASKD